MKITKRQLKRIIKEEKQKILKESPTIGAYEDANRSLGSFANVSTVDQVTDSILDLLQEVEFGIMDDGMDDDEMAEEAARNAAILAVANAFEAAGLMDVKFALHRLLR